MNNNRHAPRKNADMAWPWPTTHVAWRCSPNKGRARRAVTVRGSRLSRDRLTDCQGSELPASGDNNSRAFPSFLLSPQSPPRMSCSPVPKEALAIHGLLKPAWPCSSITSSWVATAPRQLASTVSYHMCSTCSSPPLPLRRAPRDAQHPQVALLLGDA